MRTAWFFMAAVLQVVCRDQKDCEIFPENPVVPYGSDLTLFFKAPSGSDCRSKTPFTSRRIFWTLNERKIDERFYDFNSTFASVSIRNVSVERGTVECFLHAATPVLLHGTYIQTYPLFSGPQNVSCIAKLNNNPVSPRVTCMWDHDQYTTDIKYTVCLKQNKEMPHRCKSSGKKCTFGENMTALLTSPLSIHVIAKNSYGYSARSNETTYIDVWAIVQMDSPEDVIAEPLPKGLKITWKIEQKFWINKADTESEIRLREKGSNTEPLVISVSGVSTEDVTVVKHCTNYTVSVRSRYHGSVWSTWSHEVTALSYLNVSSLQFRRWRTRSVLGDKGKRTVHLMWKGVPPSCNAIDEYRIFCDSLKLPECFGPNQNHTFITLDEHPHRITVAAFRNDTSLNEASIAVPAMAKEISLPQIQNISVFVRHGSISVSWEKPRLPVSGYIIVWNSTAKNHMWQQTLKNSFNLKGEIFALYTISLTPLYKDGPGNEVTLHNCSHVRSLAAVSNVQLTAFSDKHAEIHWLPLLPSQCCAFVLNYTVFYKTYNEPKTRNVTVGPSQHYVVLEDLQARTTYSVYIKASTVAASSKSVPIIFSTKPSKFFLIVLVLSCLGLILLSMFAVMIQRKYLSKRIPDPRFSSLSKWPSDKCRNPWSLLPMPGGRDTEKILPCHVDSEVISVSPTSRRVLAAVKTLTDIQNIATRETSSQSQKTPLAASFSNKGQLPFGRKEQRAPPVPSLDFQTSGISPQEFSLPPIQSPYRKQTPLSSPMESPTKPLWSDETERLLTPKLKNTTYFTSYVTLDTFEPGKRITK